MTKEDEIVFGKVFLEKQIEEAKENLLKLKLQERYLNYKYASAKSGKPNIEENLKYISRSIDDIKDFIDYLKLLEQ
jgi:hypothetical protein